MPWYDADLEAMEAYQPTLLQRGQSEPLIEPLALEWLKSSSAVKVDAGM
jgi:hypothetical protein